MSKAQNILTLLEKHEGDFHYPRRNQFLHDATKNLSDFIVKNPRDKEVAHEVYSLSHELSDYHPHEVYSHLSHHLSHRHGIHDLEARLNILHQLHKETTKIHPQWIQSADELVHTVK